MSRRISLCFALAALIQAGCLKKMALSAVADGLSGNGSSFAADDDPALVAEAIPFALKTMESLLPSLPDHAGLHLSACSGFTQYAYAFVLTPARQAGAVAVERAQSQRAKKLLLRARGYCLQALDIAHPNFTRKLFAEKNGLKADAPLLRALEKDDVPAIYWLSASWVLAITALKEQVDMVGDLPVIDLLMQRALALDEAYDAGTLHELMISFDGGRSPAMGGSAERARKHFARAVELSRGHKAGPYVSLAENVAVSEQNRKDFEVLLKKALAVDVDKVPEWRLANTLAQARARYLLSKAEDLILGD